jgi:hypothetical protein
VKPDAVASGKATVGASLLVTLSAEPATCANAA